MIINTEHELVELNRLTPHPDNPRQGDLGAVIESIKANGFWGSLVVQQSTGHHRLLAALELGYTQLPVTWVDVDDRKALKILLADNHTSDLATFDQSSLAEILEGLAKEGDLAGTSYDGDDLDQLIAELAFAADAEGAGPDYSQKVESPIYEPTGEPPQPEELFNRTVTDTLVEAVRDAEIPADVRDFLLQAAERHTKFNFERIANYYAHAPSAVQSLMEDSALVIVDFGKAIERGFVQLNEDTDAAFREDYPDA